MVLKTKADPLEYVANRNRIGLKTLSRYEGLCVAISRDGKRILTSGKNDLQVIRNAEKKGLKRSQYVIDFVPDLDAVLIM